MIAFVMSLILIPSHILTLLVFSRPSAVFCAIQAVKNKSKAISWRPTKLVSIKTSMAVAPPPLSVIGKHPPQRPPKAMAPDRPREMASHRRILRARRMARRTTPKPSPIRVVATVVIHQGYPPGPTKPRNDRRMLQLLPRTPVQLLHNHRPPTLQHHPVPPRP